MLSSRKYIWLYLIWFGFSFWTEECCLAFLKTLPISLTFHASAHILPFSPAFWQNPHMDFNKVHISIVTIWPDLLLTNYILQYNTHIWDLAWVTICSYFNDQWWIWKFCWGGRAIIVSIKRISKMGMVCIIYGEISEGSGHKLPPWIIHLCHWLKSQMWIPLYDILIGILWWILQINVSFTIFHNTKEKKIWYMLSKSDKYLLLTPSSNKHKIIVYLLPK